MKLTILFFEKYKIFMYLVYKIEGTRRYKYIANICYFSNKWIESSSYELYRLQTRAAIILSSYSEYQYKAYKYSDIPEMCRGACQESQCECTEYVRKSDNAHVLRHVNVPPII